MGRLSPEAFERRWHAVRRTWMAVEERYLRERLGPGGYASSYADEVRAAGDAPRETVRLYRRAGPVQREEIRALFRSTYRLRRILLASALPPALESGDPGRLAERIRGALAALSIEDNQTDVRDTYATLAAIWETAQKGGIDVRPLVAEAAGLSGTAPSPGGSSMRAFLLGFERSAYFAASVAPRLRESEPGR